MLIRSVLLKNFRAIAELSLDLDDLTILLGANSAGKSTVIRAIEWFFEGGELPLEDVRNQDRELTTSVRVTFTGFNEADRAAFPGYTTGETMTLLRTRNPDGSIKLTGRGIVYPPFREIRAIESAVPLRVAYTNLVRERPELDLPAAGSKDQALAAMEQWEHEHVDRCEEDDKDATHLLGAVGGGVLRQRFKFVLVPALRDATDEAREAKGSALGRLLSVIAEQRAAANEKISELEAEIRERYESVVLEAHGTTLEELSTAMTEQIRTFVSGGEVRLQALPGTRALPAVHVVVEAGEGGSLTDIGCQGHGFQRAFIITALRYLSEATMGGQGAPTIFLALEEPELYQHPVRARHFAAVLDRLAERETGRVQVLYATHSPYFVNARKFPSVRVFRRPMTAEGALGAPTVTHASEEDLVHALDGVIEQGHVSRRLARTIDVNLAFGEAFFADAVLLVEGPHDLFVVREVATICGESLEENGVVGVCASKSGIPVAAAILKLLQIPVYIVFDGDANVSNDALAQQAALNAAIQKIIGVESPDEFPATQVQLLWASFEGNLESFLDGSIKDFSAKCQAVAVGREWRAKSGEVYAEVIRAEPKPPLNLVEIVRRVLELRRASLAG